MTDEKSSFKNNGVKYLINEITSCEPSERPSCHQILDKYRNVFFTQSRNDIDIEEDLKILPESYYEDDDFQIFILILETKRNFSLSRTLFRLGQEHQIDVINT